MITIYCLILYMYDKTTQDIYVHVTFLYWLFPSETTNSELSGEPNFFLYSKGLRVLVKGLTPLNSTIQTITANTTATVTANVTITTTATTVYCFNYLV